MHVTTREYIVACACGFRVLIRDTVSVYPNDPQARVGLTKCMDALQDMEAVWPSAARAHELLRGSDPLNRPGLGHGGFGQGQVVARHGHGQGQERTKRAAECAVDVEDAYERSQMHVPSSSSYVQTWRSTQFSMAPEAGVGAGGEFGTGPGVPGAVASSSSGASSSSPYYPWPAGPPGTASASDGGAYVPFPGTLSTSVLPQMYSTGLMDERRVGHGHGHGHGMGQGQGRLNGQSASGASHGGGYDSTGGRYPQYWNDYTSFPQMEMAYGQGAVQGGGGQGQEGMYLGEQYHEGIYGACP